MRARRTTALAARPAAAPPAAMRTPTGAVQAAGFPLGALRLGPSVRRQVPPAFPLRRRFPEGSGVDPAGGGATAFEETVTSAPARTGTTIAGDVERREFVPGSGGAADVDVSRQTAHVRMDLADCAVELPYRFFFQQQNASNSAQICQDPPSAQAATALPQTAVDSIADRYVGAVNSGLADWFTVRLAGCGEPCAGREMPIRPRAERVASAGAADKTITIVPRGGRGDAATICAGDFSTSFAGHEGGHQLLGSGDEYTEHDAALLAAMPQWGRRERVRTGDLSIMADSHNRFAVFHERHFRHVPAFLEAAFPGCTAALTQTSRALPAEFGFTLGGGLLSGSFGSGAYGSAGFDVGITADRLREVRLLLGMHGTLFQELDEPRRSALMLGLRLGVERRWAPGGPVTGYLGAHAEAGGMAGLSGFGPGTPVRPYGEIGITGGIRSGLPGIGIGAEIVAGSAEAFPGAAPGLREPPPNWLRYGLTITGAF